MLSFVEDIIKEEGSWILRINLIFMLVFLLVTIVFILSILYMRFQKIIKEHQTKKLQEILINFINTYLFDESYTLEDLDFQRKNLKTVFDRKIAIKVLLIFEENFKGSSNSLVRDLFFHWGLHKLIEEDLNSSKWYKVARSIYVSSELNLIDFQHIIEPYLNSEKNEVRQQAILYFINISLERPLDFLDKIQIPLTLWEQIYIEECLKTKYSGPVPDFSKWLDSSMLSVQLFSMNMIKEYNQFENIEKLTPFLFNTKEDLKNAAIENLGKMEYFRLMEYCDKTFDTQSPRSKKVILNILRRIGSIEEFLKFENRIPARDWINLQVFNKLKVSYINESKSINV